MFWPRPVYKLVRVLRLLRVWLLVEVVVPISIRWWDILGRFLSLIEYLWTRGQILSTLCLWVLLLKFWWLLMRILLVERCRIVVVVQLQIHIILLENWRLKLLFVLLFVHWDRLNGWDDRLLRIYSCRFVAILRVFPKLLVKFLHLHFSSLWWRIHFRCVVPHRRHLSWPIRLAPRLNSILFSASLKLHLHRHGHVLGHCLSQRLGLSSIPSL